MSYAIDKLGSHPGALAAFREGKPPGLITVHLMPQNLCNQRCSFCSYRLPDNKNSARFNEGAHIPWPAMAQLLADFDQMGVQGVEVTGGGEPLAYPMTRQLWEEFSRYRFRTALVSNGTLLRPELAPVVTAARLSWARISIDAASEEIYAEMRKCPRGHFRKAWAAVRLLREHAPQDPDFRLGVGFVLCNENMAEVYDFVRLASESGADNCRLSVTFSDQHEDFFRDKRSLAAAVEESERAVIDFHRPPAFVVNNLMPKRHWEVQHPAQDYVRCPSKDVLCVVEGECKVYTCCTFTGSVFGLYGKFTEHASGFHGLWDDFSTWRSKFDASKYCQCSCLYRDRNLAMNALIDGIGEPPAHDGVHREFI